MSRRLATLFPLLLSSAVLAAPEEPTKAPGSEAAALEAKVAALRTTRDPFHHPNYKKAPEASTSGTPVVSAAEITAKLNVQGRIKRGNEYFIMLNGRLIGRGDIIDVADDSGKPVRMRVLAVTQDNIQLESLSN